MFSSLKDINNISHGSRETTDPSKYLVPSLVAAGCEAVGIILLITAGNQHKKSINIYNSKHTTGFNSNKKIELGLTQNGIGLRYTF